MRYVNSHNIEDAVIYGSVVMLGNFDGMHRGHLQLFDVLAQQADACGLAKVVFSLWPHPLMHLKTGSAGFGLLLSSREKARILKELGTDVFVEYPFDDVLQNMSPEIFVREIILGKLRARAIVIGDDYAFGKNRQGDTAFLQDLGKKCGFDVHVVSAVTHGGQRVSSRTIRRHLGDRDLALCNELMTRPYQISGLVMPGKQLARHLGFPTINIDPPPEKILPPNGVYLTDTTIVELEYGQTYESITNVGINPTVAGSKSTIKRCETYLYDFNEDIYGKEVIINFYESHRGERVFKDIDALKRQIEIDVETGRKLWTKLRLQ